MLDYVRVIQDVGFDDLRRYFLQGLFRVNNLLCSGNKDVKNDK